MQHVYLHPLPLKFQWSHQISPFYTPLWCFLWKKFLFYIYCQVMINITLLLGFRSQIEIPMNPASPVMIESFVLSQQFSFQGLGSARTANGCMFVGGYFLLSPVGEWHSWLNELSIFLGEFSTNSSTPPMFFSKTSLKKLKLTPGE